jgi:hypothetical protein
LDQVRARFACSEGLPFADVLTELSDNYFLACEPRDRGVDPVAGARYERVGAQTLRSGPDGEALVGPRPNKPHGTAGGGTAATPRACSCAR